MKDAKGHGSNPRGVTSAHATGVDQIGQTKMMPVGRIHPTKDVFLDSTNPHLDPVKAAEVNKQNQDEIDGMRATIRSGGSLPPLIVTPKGNLLDGHHRLEAYKAEKIRSAPVQVQRGYNENEIERVQREKGLRK